MTIKQLSVFLENKAGRINEVARILGNNGVDMVAFSLSANQDFGILHMIVSDVELATRVLKAEKFTVKITEVVCFICSNTPGALATVLDYLVKDGVFIEYMYAFAQGATANVVIRPSDVQRCIGILERYKCKLITENAIRFDFEA